MKRYLKYLLFALLLLPLSAASQYIVTNHGKIVSTGNLPDANGWVRPYDWLPISNLVTDGEEKAVGLYAVYQQPNAIGQFNYASVYATGAYTVDWGDGNVVNYASGVTAEHTYAYDDLSANTYCTRGYRQAIVTITPQAGQHLTGLNFGRLSSEALPYTAYATGWLDMHVSGTHLALIKFWDNGARATLLEHFDGYQATAAATNMEYMFANCYSLQSLDLSSFNTAAVTSMVNMFSSCTSLQSLDLSSFNTAAATSMSNMFNGCTSLQSLDLSSFNTAAVTSMANMFNGCTFIRSISLPTLIAVTDNTNIVNGTGQISSLRLPYISKTFTVANNKLDATALNTLFGDLKDLTSGTAQTITITGNPGAATCNQAIATAKNWIVVN